MGAIIGHTYSRRFFVLYLIGGIWGREDRPYMKRPDDRSIRMPVGSWFFDR